jgi:formate dehydrogenase
MSSEPSVTAGRIHPGAGRRRGVPFPKGRGVDVARREEVARLLGNEPPRRDLLIEYLHLIQDAYGALRAAHLVALADLMHLALAEVYEVATFYAHFDVLDDTEPPLPPTTVRVCTSISCHLAGASALLEGLKCALEPSARVLGAPCMGLCEQAPAVMVNHAAVGTADAEKVAAMVHGGELRQTPRGANLLDAYRRQGGYRLLEQCRSGATTAEAVLDAIEKAGLRGLGGAGFKTAQKWRLVREQPGPRLLAVNADEGEPGTFKDRYYLETEPHRVLEGMLVAAWVVNAEHVYIYLRDEYPHIHDLLLQEIGLLELAGLISPGAVVLRRGAGAYICGEETAMLESLEGKRGYPRHKPPFPTQVGLFGRPTLINNVETLYWVRDIVERGPDWFSGWGRRGRQGPRSFSVSGRVRNPGVKLAPAGISVRELIDEYCGGMPQGHTFKGYLPGGASGGILPASLGDLPLDFGTLEPHGCFIGSAAIVVLSDQDNTRDVALNLMEFFADESCGQCTPCRCGTEKAVGLMSQPNWDLPLLQDLSSVMRDASICGLGQAAPNPLLCVMRYFPEDLP